jgi:molecular chaperone GrpE
MTKDGRVKHEEPMIPTLPHISARGVGPDQNTPFVLPATATGMGMMEKNPAYSEEKSEPVFENALRHAKDLPIAPIVKREDEDPQPQKVEPKKSDVLVATANVSISYDGEDTEVPAIPEELPELIEEIVEEPVAEPIEEPEVIEPEIPEEPEVPSEPEIPDEPVATIVEEPVVEEPIVEEPEVAPVFTDAEQADELMTDEEAEEHIEIIEEAPGRERKGKFHAINLDTICDHFEDGEKVKEGLRMIAASVSAVLDKLGVEAFGAPGDSFDPNIHNAIMHEEDESGRENEITDVFQKGYRKGNRIIRFAMVKTVN